MAGKKLTLEERLAKLPPFSKAKEPRILIRLHCFEWYIMAAEQAPNGSWHVYALMVSPDYGIKGYTSLDSIMSRTGPLGEGPVMVPGYRWRGKAELKKILDAMTLEA